MHDDKYENLSLIEPEGTKIKFTCTSIQLCFATFHQTNGSSLWLEGGDRHRPASDLLANLPQHSWLSCRRHQLTMTAPTQACVLPLTVRILCFHCRCLHCYCQRKRAACLPANPLLASAAGGSTTGPFTMASGSSCSPKACIVRAACILLVKVDHCLEIGLQYITRARIFPIMLKAIHSHPTLTTLLHWLVATGVIRSDIACFTHSPLSLGCCPTRVIGMTQGTFRFPIKKVVQCCCCHEKSNDQLHKRHKCSNRTRSLRF